MVTAMTTNKSNTQLFTADNFGFLYVWNIDQYATDMSEGRDPESKLRNRLII